MKTPTTPSIFLLGIGAGSAINAVALKTMTCGRYYPKTPAFIDDTLSFYIVIAFITVLTAFLLDIYVEYRNHQDND